MMDVLIACGLKYRVDILNESMLSMLLYGDVFEICIIFAVEVLWFTSICASMASGLMYLVVESLEIEHPFISD
jgi:hypothetical protein